MNGEPDDEGADFDVLSLSSHFLDSPEIIDGYFKPI